jgi:hypothetical protein
MAPPSVAAAALAALVVIDAAACGREAGNRPFRVTPQ